ncbi:hypothetical protein BBD39_06890 [Arsenophonus endosymbiont of Bemisia tabaci Asia II 3]|nr:hypothetical protein BBD39_06890 [Arsenophonus endosymbiont of Bemisia tabaci Asia II 3]
MRTNRIQFGQESFLPATVITAKVTGRNPADFQLSGALSAQQIGPIPFANHLGDWLEKNISLKKDEN